METRPCDTRTKMEEDLLRKRWRAIIDRCQKTTCNNYKNYGGRGITVCDRWLVFDNFKADMGYIPKGMSIGRKDNDGPYSPDNCRWETQREQVRNKRNTLLIEIDGEAKMPIEWSEETGISESTIKSRFYSGKKGSTIISEERLPFPLGATTKHGFLATGVKTPKEYARWFSMKNRCYSVNSKGYISNGSRGIKVCDRWKDSFVTFLEDMGYMPEGKTFLCRSDDNKDYSPENCFWGTKADVACNREKATYITHNSERLSLSEWSRRMGIRKDTLMYRYKKYGNLVGKQAA